MERDSLQVGTRRVDEGREEPNTKREHRRSEMEDLEMLSGVDAGRSGLTAEQMERRRMLAMRAWEMRPLQRVQPHPAYRNRRGAESKALLWHGMGALTVLGALMLISTF